MFVTESTFSNCCWTCNWQAIRQIAKHLGLKSVDIASRPEQMEELFALGADEVICPSTEDIVRARQITSKQVAYSALDDVDGDHTKVVTANSRLMQQIPVPHVKQLHSWDCGLACVSMVLRALGIEDCDLKSLAKLCATSSIWTIDLAHLLSRFAVDVSLITVTVGANPRFAVESFYQDNMEDDSDRVNALFERAPLVGIQVQRRSISGEEICMLMLSGRYVAIVLVDKRRLSHPWLDDICLGDCCGIGPGFTGHYVVICGYDMETDEFEIRDPASSSGSERISFDTLEAARRSFGTDEDILYVNRHI